MILEVFSSFNDSNISFCNKVFYERCCRGAAGQSWTCAGLAHEQGKAAWGPATCLKELQESLCLSLLDSLKKDIFSIFEEFRVCMH